MVMLTNRLPIALIATLAALTATQASSQTGAGSPAPAATPAPVTQPTATTAPVGGRRGLMQACQADIASLCAGITPGGGRIRACVTQNSAKLSTPCADAIKNARSAFRAGGGR